jgi:hypothetical protein
MNTSDIPVLHSAKVAHLYPQVVLPIFHEVDRTTYTSIEEARQGSTTSEREIVLIISYNRFWWLTSITNHVD